MRQLQNKAVIFVTCELLHIESNLASSVPYYTIRMLFPNRNGCLVLAEAMNGCWGEVGSKSVQCLNICINLKPDASTNS
jgi:hypothetical protein